MRSASAESCTVLLFTCFLMRPPLETDACIETFGSLRQICVAMLSAAMLLRILFVRRTVIREELLRFVGHHIRVLCLFAFASLCPVLSLLEADAYMNGSMNQVCTSDFSIAASLRFLSIGRGLT